MIFKVDNLSRRFGKVQALDRVSFEFSSGGIIGFVGPNGSGKTTLMQIVAGLDEPDSGDVLLDGVSAVDFPDLLRRRIGFMPDSLPDASNITVQEYLEFFAAGFNDRDGLQKAVEFTGVSGFRKRKLSELSKGMKQRVALARLLIHDPDLVLLDEPAAGLDPAARIELRDMLKNLADQGKTVFLSSHILSELEDIVSGVVIISNGRLLCSGMLGDLLGSAKLNQLEPVEEVIALRNYTGDIQEYIPRIEKLPGVVDTKFDGRTIFCRITSAIFAEFVTALLQTGFPLASLQRINRTVALENLFLNVVAKG